MTAMFRCAGCGAALPEFRLPFRCPAARAGDDVDHVVVRTRLTEASVPATSEDSLDPFDRHRHRLSSYALARSGGLSDETFREMAAVLDRSVARVDGHGFLVTPFLCQPELSARLGFHTGSGIWAKDETGNVSGSHKARHLFGIMLYLQVAERLGLVANRPSLAIASCGNAALSAAVVAGAAGWPLSVFVPPSASRAVLARLEGLGARVNTRHREPGVAGDPCYLAFRKAVADGAVPFCCQGSDNGLTIEGGQTLAWEMVEQLAASSRDPAVPGLDAVFIQVGGGALASSVVQGFEERRRAGAIATLPRFYTVQTAGGYPLARAYDRLVARLVSDWPAAGAAASESMPALATAIVKEPARIDEAMAFARTHRSHFMWPWEDQPRSIAHGILDDETYDWAAVVEGMLRTGGRPLVVGEARLRAANDLARSATGIDVDHTGSAGLAGLMEAVEEEPALRGARVAVIFSGRIRRE